ncbi:MAG TPA: hypothetical protein PK453_18870 [Leptospiraceae bacterium]|nr:hypothetical protein [Leptospiraceae bacterium]
MPIELSVHTDIVEKNALVKFQKDFGFILSSSQFPKQRLLLIQSAVRGRKDYVNILSSMDRQELLSFLFILSQFGDAVRGEAPEEFIYFSSIPYVVEWQKGKYSVPSEILEYLSGEKIFRDQNYIFALLPMLPLKEKKSWIKWLEKDFQGNEKQLNQEIYRELRKLVRKRQLKSIVKEKESPRDKLWKPGESRFMDWYYKDITTFYFAAQEMEKAETDPLISSLLQEIKCGRWILKKDPEKFQEKTSSRLVATVEGSSFQFRETEFSWEMEHPDTEELLFHGE